MQQIILVNNPEAYQQQWHSNLPPFDPTNIAQHTPDAHLILVRDDNYLVGRCSLWWQNTPPLPGYKIGLIGHYAVQDAAAASYLLEYACQQLAANNCTLAVGPMDGNTWRRYRLLTDRGAHPIFFLEPDNPDDWPLDFVAQGFTPLAHYSSALCTDLGKIDPRLQQVRSRLHTLGVQIRPVDLQHIEQELHRIYTIAISSFRRNFLYTPISEAEFINQYRPLLPYLRPELIAIAEHSHQPVGFLLAIPDILLAQRGGNVNTIIIKTVAVLPNRIYAGLGNLLVANCHAIAQQLGYSQIIHALMHDANPSRNLSQRYAHTIRRYALFSKQLR